MNPGWELRFYDDQACLDFVQREFPEYLAAYLALPKQVERSDFFRYMVCAACCWGPPSVICLKAAVALASGSQTLACRVARKVSELLPATAARCQRLGHIHWSKQPGLINRRCEASRNREFSYPFAQVVLRYGGVYADLDTECRQPMDALLQPRDALVACWENEFSSAAEAERRNYVRPRQV